MRDVNIVPSRAGEIIQAGPVQMYVLEDGSRTDNRLAAVEIVLPPGIAGPPRHLHRMHDETFLVTSGVIRFTVGDSERDAGAGDYVVVPIGAAHTFANHSDAPAAMFNSFTPAFYLNYLREMAALATGGGLDRDTVARVMARYATEAA